MKATPYIRHFVTLDELATRLALPRTWLRKLADAGDIPAVCVGRRRVFDLDLVRAVILERANQSAEDSSCPN